MNGTPSLDERYLEFNARTAPIFARYPRLEALRFSLFNDLVARHAALDWKAQIKHWARPALRRGDHTAGSLDPSEVLIEIEGRRTTSSEPLLRLYHELRARGRTVQLLAAPPGIAQIPAPALELHYTVPLRPPEWAAAAWDELCGEYPELDQPGLTRAFDSLCATNRGLRAELDRLLDAIRPKIVVLWSTQMPIGGTLAVAARERGIPTLLIQHGILQPFYTPVITDHMATWGSSSSDVLTALGEPAERLVALGSPRHDTMRPSGGTARAQFRAALDLPDRPTLVFFSNGNDLVRNGSAPAECAAWLDAVAAQGAGRFNIVVRLHPNEDGSLYAGCRHLRVTQNQPDLATTLDGCDVVGSLCSTVLYEGLLYHKPIWQFYADGWPDLADNWKQGLAARVASPEELAARLETVLAQGAPALFDPGALRRVFANHGTATQAVASFIEERIAQRAPERATEPAP